jgi:hypothetical protein
MIEGESHSMKNESVQPYLMNDMLTELRVACAVGGDWEKHAT